MSDEVLLQAKNAIEKGSKSFSLAAKFFPSDLWVGACLIYFWCRHCDDIIDEGGSKEDLSTLKLSTLRIWCHPDSQKTAPFMALDQVVRKYQIPPQYPLDLLEGMTMDIDGVAYYSFAELKLYCYRVASTVGLMMSHVMGLFHEKGLEQAAALGMAMQMTNIARDVKEDQSLNRLYLPLNWLSEVGLTTHNYFEKQNRERLFIIVRRLITESEKHYQTGLAGIRFLPWRSALTILIAGQIYREIGREILRKGVMALDERVVVPSWLKVFLILKSILLILPSLPGRLLRSEKPVTINTVWRLT